MRDASNGCLQDDSFFRTTGETQPLTPNAIQFPMIQAQNYHPKTSQIRGVVNSLPLAKDRHLDFDTGSSSSMHAAISAVRITTLGSPLVALSYAVRTLRVSFRCPV